MIKIIKNSLLVSLAIVLFAPLMVGAHGEAGMTFSDTVGGYIIDVDYSELTLETHQQGRFTFDLFLDEERLKPAPFTDMWVRIEKIEADEKSTIFAGPIARPEFGGIGFVYIFAEPGTYKLYVRYNNTGKNEDAETSFDLNVVQSADEDGSFDIGFEFIYGLLGGAVITSIVFTPFILKRKKA